MPNKVLINELGFIEQIYEGAQDTQTVEQMITETKKLMKDNNSIIITDLSKITETNTGARLSAVNFMRESRYKKLAIFGKNFFLNNLANIIIRASGENKKNRVFQTKEQATKWLLES